MDEVAQSNRGIHKTIQDNLLKWIRMYLLMSFNWPGSKSYLMTFGFIILMLGCFIMIVLQHIFVYLNLTNIDYVTGTYFTLVAVIIVVYKHMILYQKRKSFAAIINIIKDDLWPLTSFDLSHKLGYVIKTVRISITIYCIGAVAISQMLMFFPYVDKLPGQRAMPILCWYPFDANQSPIYEITYTWITLVGLYVGLGVASFDSLFIYFQFSIILQLRLLKAALMTIDEKYRYIDNEDKLYKKLSFCIQYHQKLNEFYEQVQELYETHNAVNILISGINFCCLIYLIQKEQDPVKALKLMMYIIVVTANAGIYCVTGSLIKAETEDLPFAIYNAGWEKNSQRFQKAVLFMIKAAQVPRIITAGKLAEVGNMTLITVIKTAFSISVFLNDVDKENQENI